MPEPYKYRAAFGCWINDMRNSAIPCEDWPSIVIDDKTEEDYLKCVGLARRAGFNSMNIFGFFANYSWSCDVPATIPDERKIKIIRLIEKTRELGLKVYCGLGVYSWGFDEIIAKNPGVRGTNPHAMCYSSPESFEWMKKVLDYVLAYDFDGIHLESSDLGRCSCEKCSEYGDAEYYSIINALCADYLRSEKKDIELMVNMSGYMRFGTHVDSEEDFQALVSLSGHIDYLIDGGHYGFFVRGEYRRRAFKEFSCAFGSSGKHWVYMPQRWDKLRWFLPTVAYTCGFLREDYRLGARAVEYYMGAVINPGVEMNIYCGGALLLNPERGTNDIMREAVEVLYEPKNSVSRERIENIFNEAEEAYYGNVNQETLRTDWVNELHLEPLFGSGPGKPVYLSDSFVTRYDEETKKYIEVELMSREGRARYKAALLAITSKLSGLENETGRPEKIGRIKICVDNALKDVESFAKK